MYPGRTACAGTAGDGDHAAVHEVSGGHDEQQEGMMNSEHIHPVFQAIVKGMSEGKYISEN